VELVGRFRNEISAPVREAKDDVIALRGALGEVSELLTKLSASGGSPLKRVAGGLGDVVRPKSKQPAAAREPAAAKPPRVAKATKGDGHAINLSPMKQAQTVVSDTPIRKALSGIGGAAAAVAGKLGPLYLLRRQIQKDQFQLGNLEGAMRRLKGGSNVSAAAVQKLQTQIDRKKESISKAQARVGAMGGSLTDLGGRTSRAGGLLAKGLAKGLLMAEALKAVAGAAVGGAAGLGRLALGYRGMERLHGITARLSLNFRGLFAGLNPKRALDAFERFTKLFSKQTVTGRVLSGVFARVFDGLSRALETAEPYLAAFAQGMVLGFLHAENAVLRARIAFFPLTSALDRLIGKQTLLRVTMYAGALVFGVIAAAAIASAVSFAVVAGAIGLVVYAVMKAVQWFKELLGLSKPLEASLSGIGDVARATGKMLGAGGKGGASGGKAAAATDAGALAPPGPAKQGGEETGLALAAGMLKGILGSLPALHAAGGSMAKGVEAGAKEAGEIHSPSRLTARVGRNLGRGVAVGMEAEAPAIQRTAERALVPDFSRAGVSALRPAGRSPRAPSSIQIGPFHFPAYVGDRAELEAWMREAVDRRFREAMAALGLDLEGDGA
jgi:hypothetical protein